MSTSSLKKIMEGNILDKGRNKENFVGRPFYLDYAKAKILISDAWKFKVGGIPQGSFLLAFYTGEDEVREALLLRAIGPAELPTDKDVIRSMIEYYKDDLDISGRAGAVPKGKLDEFSRYEFSFSGLACRVLGVFYETNNDAKAVVEFGADLENFYSSNNYEVYKATGDVLKAIVNQRDGVGVAGSASEFKIGNVRYSSSRRFQNKDSDKVDVYISPKDFLGKRTALFGMTRTGKSNTVKKVIEATVEISDKSKSVLSKIDKLVDSFDENSSPTFPVGQIIFDINGEYANPNMQDDGTAIYELYSDRVVRYSVLKKEGFEVMKINFYIELVAGMELIQSFFKEKNESSDYVNNFLSVVLEEPVDYANDFKEKTNFDRVKAAYICCLKQAGFKLPPKFKVKFSGHKDINPLVRKENVIDPSKGISVDDAIIWFTQVWDNYNQWDYFSKYKEDKGYEWAHQDLKSLLGFLTRKKTPGSNALVSGFLKLKNNDLLDLHTDSMSDSFEKAIPEQLSEGKIVIIDLSQGSKVVQNLFSEKICERVFNESMSRFVRNLPNNFIQFYFEEAHNLFPKKDDKDLSQIYNRIAKEGAKLNLGMIYATQEVSSISSNILKNTQNWFIAHLNNVDELRELQKFYDFEDFTDSLIRFSAQNDKGFVRMKTYTNPFVVPVQIDRFLANK